MARSPAPASTWTSPPDHTANATDKRHIPLIFHPPETDSRRSFRKETAALHQATFRKGKRFIACDNDMIQHPDIHKTERLSEQMGQGFVGLARFCGS